METMLIPMAVLSDLELRLQARYVGTRLVKDLEVNYMRRGDSEVIYGYGVKIAMTPEALRAIPLYRGKEMMREELARPLALLGLVLVWDEDYQEEGDQETGFVLVYAHVLDLKEY